MEKQIQLSNEEYKEIVNSIGLGTCVAIIGPGLATDWSPEYQVDRPLVELFANELANSLPDVQDANNLPHVAMIFVDEKGGQEPLYKRIEDFYRRRSGLSPALRQTARLPVRLFIYAAADHLLKEAVCQSRPGENVLHEFFSLKNGQQQTGFDSENSEETLVYNLFGSTEEPESMTITEAHQVEFVSKLLSGSYKLPGSIVNFVKKSTLLFIGFDFETWYARLLFQAFGLDTAKTNRRALARFVDKPRMAAKVFFQNQFHLKFSDLTTEDFLNQLGERASWPEKKVKTRRRIFVIVAHEDREKAETIRKHFKSLLDDGHSLLFSIDIPAGSVADEWFPEQVDKADLVLLLLSINFWNSESIVQCTRSLREWKGNKSCPEIGWVKMAEYGGFDGELSSNWQRCLPSNKMPLFTQPDLDATCALLLENLKKRLEFLK